MLSRKTRPGRGFTLVELMVGLLVIGILLAILLPVTANLRARSQAMTCLSNMRQVAMGILNYASDNQGALPKLYSTPGWKFPYWTKTIEPYVMSEETAILPGQHVADVFYSPAVDRHHPIGDYALNSHLAPYQAGPDGLPPRVGLNRIEDPASIGLLFQGASQNGLYDATWYLRTPDALRNPEDYLDAPHDDRSHVAFVDGSVQSYSKEELVERFPRMAGEQLP